MATVGPEFWVDQPDECGVDITPVVVVQPAEPRWVVVVGSLVDMTQWHVYGPYTQSEAVDKARGKPVPCLVLPLEYS